MSKVDYTNAAAVLETFKSADTNSYDSKKLSASITSIRTAGRKLDARIHATAVGLMDRAVHNRDCSLVGALIDALPASGRRKDLIAWFHAFSNVRIRHDQKADAFKANMLGQNNADWLNDDAQEAKLAEAFAKPFYSVEEATRTSNPFVLSNAIAALLKKAEKAVDAMSDEDKAAIADLKEMQAKLVPAE